MKPAFRLFLSPTIILLAAACGLSSCSLLSSNVIRLNPEIERQHFNPASPPVGVDLEHEDIDTQWKFGETATVQYEFEDKQQLGDGWFVKIKVTGVKMALSCKVSVFVPEGAPQGLEEHADGHVAIIKRVYDDADRAAREAAASVTGVVFAGEGKTLEEACDQAVADAKLRIARVYSSKTAEVVNDVAGIYDYLQCAPNAVAKGSVREAFDEYAKGKPKRLKAH